MSAARALQSLSQELSAPPPQAFLGVRGREGTKAPPTPDARQRAGGEGRSDASHGLTQLQMGLGRLDPNPPLRALSSPSWPFASFPGPLYPISNSCSQEQTLTR